MTTGIGLGVGAILVVLGSLLGSVFATILGDEIRGWVRRIPYGLLWIACLRVPAKFRRDMRSEWCAEIDAKLTDKDDRPLTRLILGTKFAAGMIRGGKSYAVALESLPDNSTQLIKVIAINTARDEDYVRSNFRTVTKSDGEYLFITPNGGGCIGRMSNSNRLIITDEGKKRLIAKKFAAAHPSLNLDVLAEYL